MSKLPKGLRLDKHGAVDYVQVRIFNNGEMYTKNFGPDSPTARQVAGIHLAEKRKEILMGKIGVSPELPRKRFKDVAAIFVKEWGKELDPNGKPCHSDDAAVGLANRLGSAILPTFGNAWYDEIRPIDVKAWRDKRTQTVTGTTANREQVILGSIFSSVEKWIKIEKIPAFKTPAENPCTGIEKAPLVKRERNLSEYEISKLLWAAKELGDDNGLENIVLALETCLSLKDLHRLHLGDTINLKRTKTGVDVLLPIVVLHQPSWVNWRKRFEAIRAKAGIKDVEFKDLRKSGGNLLVGLHDVKLVSQYMGHADVQTTEGIYTKVQAEKMSPLAKTLKAKINALRPK